MKSVIAAILIATICCSSAWARDKTDVVILDNGDRITGEIKQLQHGRLQISTDRMGVVTVEWDGIVHIQSDHEFQFDRTDGQRIYGQIRRSDEDGQFVIVNDDEAMSIAHDRLVRISQLEDSFWDSVRGSMTLGYSFTKASDVAQFNLGLHVSHRTLIRQHSIDGTTISTNDQATETTQRSDLRLATTRFRSNRWFNAFLMGFESNDELGLNLRSSIGATIGRYLHQTNTAEFALLGGLLGSNESLTGDAETQNNLEGLVGLEFSKYSFDDPNIDMSLRLVAYPSITDTGRTRAQFDATIRYELISDLFWDLTFYEIYDNKPPSGSESTHDYGVVTSLGWSF